MGIPHDGGLRRAHAGPALQWRVVLVDGRHHHLADVEGFLAPRVGLVRQDLADQRESVFATVVPAVRIDLHVAINGSVVAARRGKRSPGAT